MGSGSSVGKLFKGVVKVAGPIIGGAFGGPVGAAIGGAIGGVAGGGGLKGAVLGAAGGYVGGGGTVFGKSLASTAGSLGLGAQTAQQLQRGAGGFISGLGQSGGLEGAFNQGMGTVAGYSVADGMGYGQQQYPGYDYGSSGTPFTASGTSFVPQGGGLYSRGGTDYTADKSWWSDVANRVGSSLMPGEWDKMRGGSGTSTALSGLSGFLDYYQKQRQGEITEDAYLRASQQADPFGSQRAFYQTQLSNLYKNPKYIKQLPSYKFAFDQGVEGIRRAAAMAGKLNSGNIAYDLQNFGQGLAAQVYDQEANRLAGLAGSNQAGAQGAALAARGRDIANQYNTDSLSSLIYPFSNAARRNENNGWLGSMQSNIPQQQLTSGLQG